MDFSVRKNIRVAEGISMELQGVFANVFNHDQLLDPRHLRIPALRALHFRRFEPRLGAGRTRRRPADRSRRSAFASNWTKFVAFFRPHLSRCGRFFRVSLICRSALLLSDAEGAEDQVQDVVGGGGAGDGVERPEGVVEIEQQHFVRDFRAHGDAGGVERGE